MSIEQDPTGRGAHQPGAKLDAGQPMPALILDQMPRAMRAVGENY